MFTVFGIDDRDAARRFVTRSIKGGRDFEPGDVVRAVEAAKAIALYEFDLPATALDYAARLRAKGWRDVDVKIQILVQRANGSIGKEWIPATALDSVDIDKQNRLRALKDGSRMARAAR